MRTLGERGFTREEICNHHLGEIEMTDPADQFVNFNIFHGLERVFRGTICEPVCVRCVCL